MTGTNDLDRQLAVYLDVGPTRAPERSVEAAIAFSRSHPRRRDPLLFLRPDVMGRRAGGFGPQLVWAMVVLGLLLGAVAAIAIGSRRNEQPVVVPPSVEASPSVVPSPSQSPTPVSVEITDPVSETTWTVSIEDASGSLVSAEGNPPSQDEAVDRIAATNDPGDPNRLVLTWSFVGCPDPLTLTIDEAVSTLRLTRTECLDTMGGNDLRMTLTFAEPVDATQLRLELVDIPR